MTLAMVVLLVLVALVMFVVGLANRPAPAELKPFDLEAYKAHKLQEKEPVVLDAVFAAISFLEHPITVVQDAEALRVATLAHASLSRARIDQNLGKINVLRAENVELAGQAHSDDEQASELEAIVARVTVVLGDDD